MSTAAFQSRPTARSEVIGREIAPWLSRDLSRDWRGWTVAERITAGALLAGIIALPVVAVAGTAS